MKITHTKIVRVDVQTLVLCVADGRGVYGQLEDQDGEPLGEFQGTIPDFLPGLGERLELRIDLDTGTITNWCPLGPEDIEAFLTGTPRRAGER